MKLSNKILIIIVILSAILLIFNKNNIIRSNKSDIKNIRLETLKKGNIPLSNMQKIVISKYLEKQSLTKTKDHVDCAVFGQYSLTFDNYKITFDDKPCIGYLKTKDDYYQVDISADLAEYIIKISK